MTLQYKKRGQNYWGDFTASNDKIIRQRKHAQLNNNFSVKTPSSELQSNLTCILHDVIFIFTKLHTIRLPKYYHLCNLCWNIVFIYIPHISLENIYLIKKIKKKTRETY